MVQKVEEEKCNGNRVRYSTLVKNASKKGVEGLLQFAYADAVKWHEFSFIEVFDVLSLALRYGIAPLVRMCCRFLAMHVLKATVLLFL